MAFDIGNYVDVATRLVEFREKHPEGSLQPADQSVPFQIVTLGEATFIAVVAAAYRTADDPRPGIGMAYEPYPGKTPYTKDSELQNAETSAWGRAIMAALAADSRKGIASADEVRNRQEDRTAPPDPRMPLFAAVKAAGHDRKMTDGEIADDFAAWSMGTDIRQASVEQLTDYALHLRSVRS